MTLRIKNHLIGFLFGTAGIAAIAVAFLADILGVGGQSGFGSKQWILIGVGIVLILFGIGLETPPARRYIHRWIHPDETGKVLVSLSSWKEIVLTYLMYGLWFGLLAGFIEVVYRSYEKFALGKYIEMSYHFVWMTPLTYIILFMVLAILLVILRVIIGKRFTIQLLVAINLIFMFLCLYYNKPRIHIAAAIVLAFGLSYQLSRVLDNRQKLFYTLIQRTFPWMVIVFISITVFMLGFLG